MAGAGEEDEAETEIGTAAVPSAPPVGPLSDSSITASVRQKARKGDSEKAGDCFARWERGRGAPPLSHSLSCKLTTSCGVWWRML